jgi:hypothetical protein
VSFRGCCFSASQGSGILAVRNANALVVRQKLAATGADAGAYGKATEAQKGGLRGQLVVGREEGDASTSFDVTIDGVRVGTLRSNARGRGSGRFRTEPRKPDEQLLGVDPRAVRWPPCGAAPSRSREGSPTIRSTPRTSAAACPTTPGTECEDRTTAQCAAEGGVSLGAGTCPPNPCAPLPPADGNVRCCLANDSGAECEDRTAACAVAGGVNIGPGACVPNPCATTSTTLPPTALVRVACEKRADRSRASVDGQTLAPGSYRARLTSGANTAMSAPHQTIGDQVEVDFDSDPGDVGAGATPIAPEFVQGTPPLVTGELLDATDAVVASASAICTVN